MRELERDDSSDTPACRRLAIVGRGRMGTALAAALRQASSLEIDGPLPRGATGEDADAVLLCVPDGQIAAAAGLIRPGRLVGHCSGATTLEELEPHHERFSLHPLMAVTGTAPAPFTGAGAAIAGSTARARAFAHRLATALDMHPLEVADRDRAAYHAAASIASNFLVTLEDAAERLLATAAGDRELLVPLVRATVENWAALGPDRALTGPAARGDEATIARQRQAIRERAPELLPLFDTMTQATRRLAGARDGTAKAA